MRATGKLIAGRFEAAKVVRASATDAEARRLRIGKEDPVWRIQRVRFDGDNPFMHEQVSLPADLFPNLNESTSRIAFLAHQYGLLLGKAEERITIGVASQEVAAALRIPDDSPVMVLDRVVFTIDGRPVEWRVGQCRTATGYVAHMHRFSPTRHPAGAALLRAGSSLPNETHRIARRASTVRDGGCWIR